MSSSVSSAVDVPSALLIIASVIVATYVPSLISYLRAWFILQRIPSPPVDSIFSGHAKSLTQLKRHKYEQRCIETAGKPVYRLRVFNKYVRIPLGRMRISIVRHAWLLEQLLVRCISINKASSLLTSLSHVCGAAGGHRRSQSAPRVVCRGERRSFGKAR